MSRISLLLPLLLTFAGACAQGLDLGYDESYTSKRPSCPGCDGASVDGGGGGQGGPPSGGSPIVPAGSGQVALLDSRVGHAMAPLGSSVILFGGNNATVLGDTWAWTAGAWTKRSPAKSPSPRHGHTMAAFGNKVLLFGGRDASGTLLDETWEYDGVTWAQRNPVHPPSNPLGGQTMAPRGGEVVLYSPGSSASKVYAWGGNDWTELPGTPPFVVGPLLSTRGNRVVLYGRYPNISMAGVWELDGTTWGPPTDSKLLEIGPALAPLGNRVVLSGILSPYTNAEGDGNTLEWDGSTWTDRATPGIAAAPPRFGQALAQAGGKVVFFGGAGVGDGNDTWTWDASKWSLQKNVAPGAGSGAGGTAAMGLGAGKLIRVIPRDPRGSKWATGSTWEWDGAAWSEKHPKTVPVGYDSIGAAPRGNVLVLFTMVNSGNAYVGATWEWDGADWTQKNPAHSPAPYQGFGFASLGNRVVYFGGDGGQEAMESRNHTWEWDGLDWTEKVTVVKPSARVEPAMATYGSKIVMFGGGALTSAHGAPYTPRDDTWEWDGTTWTQRSPQVSPEPRRTARSALAAVGSKLVLFGGEDEKGVPLPTAWEWDGSSWTPRAGAPPPARNQCMLAPFAGRVVLYGGRVPSLGLALTDMWILAP